MRDATGGRGVDVVVDPVGGAAFDDAIRTLATDGRLLVIGFAAGGIPTVKVNRLLLRNVGVLGVAYGEYINRDPASAAVFARGTGGTGQRGAETSTAGAVSALRRRQRRCRRSMTAASTAKLVLEP